MSAGTTTDATRGSGSGAGVARRYPPLLSLVVALVLALSILPSSLERRQPAARETREYAPVPPDPDVPDGPPPPGDLGALAPLGDRAAGSGGLSVTEAGPRPVLTANPSTKRCVGDPPRQTEDPLAPPCVAWWAGDNHGATYLGVSGDEIRIVYYLDGFIEDAGCSGARCVRPESAVYDLLEPEDPDDGANEGSKYPIVRAMRVWQRYFNDRFQTYGRTVHLWVAFGPAEEVLTPEARRADAAHLYAEIRPFAVISDVGEHEDAFLEAMANKGVLNFGSLFARPSSFFERYPKLIWGYAPSIEQQSRQVASYVCTKAVGHPSVLNGNTDRTPGGDAGSPRVFGVIKTGDPAFPNLRMLAAAIEAEVERCGATIAATAEFPRCCWAKDNSITHEYANVQMAAFQEQGVTTVLWLGGVNGYYGPAADAIGYQPEWIVLGDGQLDANNPPRLMTTNRVWDGRAIAVTPQVFEPPLRQQLCYQAFRDVDGDFPEADLGFTCRYYRNLFQLFVGVQVAGPRLGPTSIDRGFRAIPAVRSADPRVPACFYLPGDHTCVKDAQAEIWDATGRPPGDASPGCWRAIAGGQRSLPGEWPDGNLDAQLTGDEPCNAYDAKVLVDQI